MNRRGVVTLGVLLLLSLQATPSRAEVTRVDVATHEDTLGGRSFGAVGAYEWITGRAHFALDPSNAANDIITDLKPAPRNTEGRVEFSAELIILRPKDPARANGVVLFDWGNVILGMTGPMAAVAAVLVAALGVRAMASER